MGIIYAITNQKGGVAKTTTAVNLAAGLLKRKKTVLLVDFDPQGNAGSGLGIDTRNLTHSIYDCIINDVPVSDVLQHTKYKGLDVLPSNIDLAGAEQELGALTDRATRLKDVLDPLAETYDYIIIDCPPSLGMLTINALTASHKVIIPIQSEYYALEGISQLIQTIRLVQQAYNKDLVIGGIVITLYDGRMRLSRQVVADVRNNFGKLVFKTVIPRNVRLSEAPSYGQTIFEYEPLSKGALAYSNLAKEVINRG